MRGALPLRGDIPLACEGCGLCVECCPAGAARLEPDVAGRLLVHSGGGAFAEAELRMGRGNSGKLVTEVKRALYGAAGEAELAIIDGSPGLGCPVMASMNGVSLALIVTEPSVSGLSDLGRLVRTASSARVRTAVCVNRADVDRGLVPGTGRAVSGARSLRPRGAARDKLRAESCGYALPRAGGAARHIPARNGAFRPEYSIKGDEKIMKIAVAAMGEQVSGHFGHCENFNIYEAENGKIVSAEAVPNPGHRPGFLADRGVEVIIAGGMGGGAVEIFNERGVEVVVGASGDSRNAAEAWLRGELKSTGSICHEHEHAHDCGHHG